MKKKKVDIGYAIVNKKRDEITKNYENLNIFEYKSDAILSLNQSWINQLEHKVVKVHIIREGR